MNQDIATTISELQIIIFIKQDMQELQSEDQT